MAKKSIKPANTGTVSTNTFDKDLVEDVKDYHLPPNSWTQARNAIPNTVVGDVGELSNEPSNELCAAAPYQIIGLIHLEEDRWVVFSTDETDSEIGLFKETLCDYTTLVNDQCLNFTKFALIKGIAKENFDCSWQVYWDDGRNPTRTLNIDDIPWIEDCTTDSEGCTTCVPTDDLDCDAIRLAPIVTNPCFTVSRGATSGEMVNGSYYVVGAYTVNQQRVTDYSAPSNIQSIFDHSNVAGSLDITIDEMDENFEEFELVLVIVRNQNTVARRVGIYSTRQNSITIDAVDDRWPSVGIDLIPLRNNIPDRSDAIYRNGEYMIRVGPTDKFDFNYQPLANQISAKWVSVEYPADYYRKGNNNTGYMRDEVYAFFIRWVYNTGDKSPSFHIPGRIFDPATDGGTIAGPDAAPEVDNGLIPLKWIGLSTASITAFPNTTLPDGGVVIAEGKMGYWESSEIYDDDKPEVWNATYVDPDTGVNIGDTTNTDFDLCGRNIRHHRFPNNNPTGSTVAREANHFANTGNKIRIMSVQFENIQPPVDNNGAVISNVVGYEILRGTREGNKSILAKGVINNMGEFDFPTGITPRKGLYQNYPFNDVRPDPFLTKVDQDAPEPVPILQNEFSKTHFTFHSPDTSYKDPFLSAKELRIYGEFSGETENQFILPEQHPKHVLITDFALVASITAGVATAVIAMQGEKVENFSPARVFNLGQYAIGVNTIAGAGILGTLQVPYDVGVSSNAAQAGYIAGETAIINAIQTTGADGATALAGNPSNIYDSLAGANSGAFTAAVAGWIGGGYDYQSRGGQTKYLGTVVSAINSFPTFLYYWSEGADATLRLIRAFSQDRQFALQAQAHCLYDTYSPPQSSNTRRVIEDSIYLDNTNQDYGTDYRINNIYRSRTVTLNTTFQISNTFVTDTSRRNIGAASGPTYEKPEVPWFATSACHYTAMVQRLRNQYGQIENIIQVPVSTCMTERTQSTSDVLFNGDIYIGRHTEKNTFFYFRDWMFNQPDGFEFNYRLHYMLPYPRWFMDTTILDTGETIDSVFSNLLTPASWSFPSNTRNLDGTASPNLFTVKERFMYLFNSGVRDFFVESEINVDLRDWEDTDTGRHYDPYAYSDLGEIFDMSIIKSTNLWKYDFSLSISKLFNNFISWGNTQKRSYDPKIAEECFVYRPNRVIYSLPQNLENEKDYWRVFLPNNYKDFRSRVTAIKPVNKNGALILFENESPVQFLGVDQLETDSGTKITIGDGGLFSQPIQNILNTDDPFEYGSCQDRLSVINTSSGIYWISQNQGKIFQMQSGVKELSAFDLKWWFATYLPYQLTKTFPDFQLIDNPVSGIGCQTIYDNKNQLAYFTKKDYVLRTDLGNDVVTYSGKDDLFYVNDILPIRLGDPNYFRDASWTVSYDPKQDSWIGYHDWHPDLVIPSKNTFLSISGSELWRHNDRCDSYCNYYGTDYPFEVEWAAVTPQQVNTLRSIEYYMEVFKYDDNCYDRFHVLDFNFDEAVIYNSEQCSGLLKLNLSPKNNAPEIITYPKVNFDTIDILYSKVEQKYRFNQFWDITDDRGEFNPAAERMIWNTQPNGYIRDLNPNNLNYNKFQLERKKFRHYKNTVLLRRKVCGNRNIVVSIANNKNLYSPR